MNIYEALKKDHQKVKGLLKQLTSLRANTADSDKKSDLIEQIRDELIPHARAEEAVFYNSLRMLDASKNLAMHGYKEHAEAETLLRSLQAMDFLDTKWKATAAKLQEVLEHHIREEEGPMFTAAKQLFTDVEATAMAATFEAMKPEIKEEGLMKTTLEMAANLMPPRFSSKFRSFDITNRAR